MAKLYFRHASMGAGKTLDLLKVAFNYEERGQNILLLKPTKDEECKTKIIKSRVGLEREAMPIIESMYLSDMIYFKHEKNKIHCILVDEVQFLSKEHIEDLSDVVDLMNIPVICYGLRVDYMGQPFESTAYLMAIADSIEEIKTVCFCGKKAIMNTLIVNGKVVKEGEQVVLNNGKNNRKYVSLCRKHWKQEIYINE